MSITAQDFQSLIITSLAAAEPDALLRLQTNVPLYWQLHARVAFPELRYWYVRRDAIRLVMACNTRAVDYFRRRQNAVRASTENAVQDSTTTGTAHSDSNSESDRTSNSAYDSVTNASGSSVSAGSRTSAQSSIQSSTMADIGAGTNTANRVMHEDAYQSNEGDTSRVDTTQYDLRHKRGQDSGDGTTRSLTAIQTTGYEVDFNPFDGSPLPSSTATTHTHTDSSTRSQVSDHTYSADAGVGSVSAPYRERTGILTLNTTPHQTQDREMYDRPVADAGSATPSMASNFTANQTNAESASSTATATGSTSASSSLTSAGSGSGTSTMEGSSTSVATSTSLRQTRGSGSSARSSQAQTQMDFLMERLHQRFEHLQELWDAATEMIQWLESQHLVAPAYVAQVISIQYPNGTTFQMANALVVNIP